MTQSTQTDAPVQQAPTKADLDAVNARLDALDVGAKRQRNRERAMHSAPHLDPPPVFVSKTLDPSMACGGIPDEVREDAEVKAMIGTTTQLAKDLQGDLSWLTDAAKHFSELTGNLMTPGETSQRLLAATFAREHDAFADKVKRVTSRLEQLDREAAKLEREEKQHATLARHSLNFPMAPHVAGELRAWLRSLPDDSARHSALRQAIHSGDKEVISAVVESGVISPLLGFRDRKSYESVIDAAERKFGGEHVARREAAKALRARVKAMRDHLHQSSEKCCSLAMLERHPALARIVENARLK